MPHTEKRNKRSCSTLDTRRKSSIKYRLLIIIFTVFLIFLLCNSFYFGNLGKRQASKAYEKFDAGQYARKFWDELNKKLDQAVDAKHFLELFRLAPDIAIERYSTRTRHVSSTHFFLLQGEGKIVSIGQEGVLICLTEAKVNTEILITTDLIFGNAVRNASGLVDSDDFPDSMDYNKVSEEINNIVMNEVIPSFHDKVKEGLKVHFVGAAEVFESDPQISPLRVIPIKLEVK
jgi:predicted lipoprotein